MHGGVCTRLVCFSRSSNMAYLIAFFAIKVKEMKPLEVDIEMSVILSPLDENSYLTTGGYVTI